MNKKEEELAKQLIEHFTKERRLSSAAHESFRKVLRHQGVVLDPDERRRDFRRSLYLAFGFGAVGIGVVYFFMREAAQEVAKMDGGTAMRAAAFSASPNSWASLAFGWLFAVTAAVFLLRALVAWRDERLIARSSISLARAINTILLKRTEPPPAQELSVSPPALKPSVTPPSPLKVPTHPPPAPAESKAVRTEGGG